MPRIGDQAAEFTARTTQGVITFPQDYAGRWVILFSHPADFTPVCTTEFMTFASMMDDFRLHNTELVGLSVDGLCSHIAWLRTIQEKIIHLRARPDPMLADIQTTRHPVEEIVRERQSLNEKLVRVEGQR